ncbi:MAG TPA: LysM domain-containing protein, partial [Bacillota bacterium]
DKIPSGFTDKVFELRYSVRKGDTLTAIARRYGVNLATIVTRNKLGNSGKIKPQAELVIPIPGERIYILGAGETLWRVAKRYGTTVELLQDLNQITDIRKIRAGQPIVLPVTVREIKNPQF